jgi:hypothetical protein
MESIEVTAHFDLTGQPTPLEFTWQGRHYQVESTGRRWQAPDGQHILVMTPGGRMFELVFTPEGRWLLGQSGPGRMAA